MILYQYAFWMGLMAGSLSAYWIDKIPLWDTKIPLYGYCSTVVFTERNYEKKVWGSYLLLLMLKGLMYIGWYLFFDWLLKRKQPQNSLSTRSGIVGLGKRSS